MSRTPGRLKRVAATFVIEELPATTACALAAWLAGRASVTVTVATSTHEEAAGSSFLERLPFDKFSQTHS